MLHSQFHSITYSTAMWQEIEQAYTAPGRHYHNLVHLNNMYIQLQECRQHIDNWQNIIIALTYHDVVYHVLQHNNEQQSAALMTERMRGILTNEDIEQCTSLILATQTHAPSKDKDTNLFTDADLSILGSPPYDYKQYAASIRKEYSIYPDGQYNPGRMKVLQHFLGMEHIYKTTHFRQRLEAQAKQNLQWELSLVVS